MLMSQKKEESSGSSSGRGGLRGVGKLGYEGGEGHIQQARQQDTQVKSKQRMHKDAKATVKPHNIKEGDTILLQRGQLSDLNCPFLSVGVM